jgi:hypothetical protein
MTVKMNKIFFKQILIKLFQQIKLPRVLNNIANNANIFLFYNSMIFKL